MDTTEPDLMRAICEQPFDDTRRLVYADWLEEHGEAERAEFIRVQISIANAKLGCNCGQCVMHGQHTNGPCAGRLLRVLVAGRFVKAVYRERELLGEYRDDWLAEYNWPIGVAAIWRRGFIDGVRCTLADWYGDSCPRCRRGALHDEDRGVDGPCPTCDGTGRINAHGPAIVLAQPVTKVEITDKQPARSIQFAGKFRWYSFAEGEPSDIGNDLFCFLRGTPPSPNTCVPYYDTHEAAVNALSLAAVNWARSVAGLPPLEEHR